MLTLRPDQHVILIVDDVPDNLAVLSDALDEAGYLVLVATDGAGALERLGYVTPHLILLDAVMPGMDGFETCRRIRALPGASHIPVIFMTGLTETEHVVRGFEVGGNDYVIKPLQPREVIARIVAQLRSASQISLANTASEASAHAVIVLDRQGLPVWQTSKALAWMAQYFAQGDSGVLPSLLSSWIDAQLDLASTDPGAVAPLR
ncbi:DNA-binding response regulator, LuxR family, partial [Oxalobacteraceae bacterium IMCC9480]